MQGGGVQTDNAKMPRCQDVKLAVSLSRDAMRLEKLSERESCTIPDPCNYQRVFPDIFRTHNKINHGKRWLIFCSLCASNPREFILLEISSQRLASMPRKAVYAHLHAEDFKKFEADQFEVTRASPL